MHHDASVGEDTPPRGAEAHAHVTCEMLKDALVPSVFQVYRVIKGTYIVPSNVH